MKLFKRVKAFNKEVFGLIKARDFKQLRIKFKKLLVGMKFTDGILFKILIYTLLISLYISISSTLYDNQQFYDS